MIFTSYSQPTAFFSGTIKEIMIDFRRSKNMPDFIVSKGIDVH